MKRKRPAATNGRAMEKLHGDFHCPFTLSTFWAKVNASRYALTIEAAALVALAFAGGI